MLSLWNFKIKNHNLIKNYSTMIKKTNNNKLLLLIFLNYLNKKINIKIIKLKAKSKVKPA
jgi:hypothetical protein